MSQRAAIFAIPSTIRAHRIVHGIIEATFYIWKKKYSGLGLSEFGPVAPKARLAARTAGSPSLYWSSESAARGFIARP